MNEKVKKAIENCRLLLNGDITVYIQNEDGGTDYHGEVNKLYNEDLETVLNLIEKQQAEIETLKRDFEIIDHECSRLEKEDIRKDRIINEMGYMISAMATGLDTVINQEEEKYCEFKNSSKDCCWKTDKACIDCIKEYFNQTIEKGE